MSVWPSSYRQNHLKAALLRVSAIDALDKHEFFISDWPDTRRIGDKNASRYASVWFGKRR
jgi:hypothetical protein